ncbi:ABC transporter ATP-binding protein [Chitinophaga sp. GCM10012297]|uniref:ATP-binding cassette domain-containing protein n=1 Tax=Chitinophaga chungangae TaxID=2821488 RepID=A0ABS3YEK5_9BACT|nr:ATP-binding cassette domain-containing protein [Chitinophaga chungangae]MBO9153117.1 ATP-binding cassette domain-containing protein [Chitinophaga chungangae]
MIYTKNLAYAHPNGRLLQFPDLACEGGNALLITGPSGAGKTTLLHLLAGLLRPASGDVQVGGTSLPQLKPSAMDAFRGKNIGLVFQRSHFIASLSIKENLLLPAALVKEDHPRERLPLLADKLRITALLHKKPAQLSQGEQQRASIARALLQSPQVLLADEPTASLDDHNCEAVAQLLAEQAQQQNAALLIVTHDNRLKQIFKDHIQLL